MQIEYTVFKSHCIHALFSFTASLLPFNTSFGDEVLPTVDDGSSGPLRKGMLSNLTSYSFFGTEQDTHALVWCIIIYLWYYNYRSIQMDTCSSVLPFIMPQ